MIVVILSSSMYFYAYITIIILVCKSVWRNWTIILSTDFVFIVVIGMINLFNIVVVFYTYLYVYDSCRWYMGLSCHCDQTKFYLQLFSFALFICRVRSSWRHWPCPQPCVAMFSAVLINWPVTFSFRTLVGAVLLHI